MNACSCDLELKVNCADVLCSNLVFTQNDGKTTDINVRVMNGNEDVSCNKFANCFIVFKYTDNTSSRASGEIDGNYVRFTIPKAMLTQCGNVIGAVQLIGASGSRLTTQNFTATIVKDIAQNSVYVMDK